ncbi:SIMPL domain-containing protein [Sporosarcina aquimarina]|uniref:SIMPL domain-containing protein n=1 Tax=Sporosarcina aquimarina TaxID=114975 RepID=A0ABU4G1G5_9BACL|nr:SIMPL domain-containing protein [Sporosarcina aquimarina]MDW0110237.1 SIMPL domain-containing protein [Sporosarcina aquimarina]
MREQLNQTMVVGGTGMVSGKPDLVSIQLGITTHAAQLSDALTDNSDRSQSVIDQLTALGVSREDIQTSLFNVSPQYDYIDGQQHFREYEVHHQLKVTVRDIQDVGEIIDAAVRAGATEVSSIQFSIDNSSELYEEALTKAVRNAQSHALALAQAAEVVLNHVPVHIQETTQPQAMPFTVQAMKMSKAPPIESGVLEVVANVMITYSYR